MGVPPNHLIQNSTILRTPAMARSAALEGQDATAAFGVKFSPGLQEVSDKLPEDEDGKDDDDDNGGGGGDDDDHHHHNRDYDDNIWQYGSSPHILWK